GLYDTLATSGAAADGGAGNGFAGTSFSACAMKSRKIGAATWPPTSPVPSVRGSSKPTNTPAARSGENPTNQASNQSLVVPVLPASGFPTAATAVPVPRWTTPCIIAMSSRSLVSLISGSGFVGLYRTAFSIKRAFCTASDPGGGAPVTL